MSWLSNHALNAMLTGMSELHRLRRRCCKKDYCQDATCLNVLMRDQDSWGGVYAADKLPPISSDSYCCYIVNSAPSSSKGEHWLAIRLRPDAVEFFDSYGQAPWHYPLIYAWLKDAMKKRRQRLLYYRQRIQGPNAFCGAYCFYFLCERPFNRSFYATLFDNPRFVFTSLDSGTKDPELIQCYLSLNDSFVFDYLYAHTQRLLSMFNDK
ncbi:MAG: hypothetical protein AAGJ80_01975 [Cyanobacteria bacterium J06553_1]